MMIEEFIEIFFGYAADNILVDLYRYPVGTMAETESSGQIDFFLEMVDCNSLFHKLNDVIRTFKMARAADTDVNIHVNNLTFLIRQNYMDQLLKERYTYF